MSMVTMPGMLCSVDAFVHENKVRIRVAVWLVGYYCIRAYQGNLQFWNVNLVLKRQFSNPLRLRLDAWIELTI